MNRKKWHEEVLRVLWANLGAEKSGQFAGSSNVLFSMKLLIQGSPKFGYYLAPEKSHLVVDATYFNKANELAPES